MPGLIVLEIHTKWVEVVKILIKFPAGAWKLDFQLPEFFFTQSNMTKTSNRLDRLPPELHQQVFEFDPTYSEIFARVLNEIKFLLSQLQELQFKSKYEKFFGRGVCYAHSSRMTYLEQFRVTSIRMCHDYHSNSIALWAYQVLLFMKLGRGGAHNSDEFAVFQFRQWDIQERHLVGEMR